MRRPTLALVVLLVLGALAHGEEPKPAKEKNDPYPEEFRRRVDAAVDRGVAWLLARQLSNGAWEPRQDDSGAAPSGDEALPKHRMGFSALMTLACLVGGVRADEPAMSSAFQHLATFPIDETAMTYDVGVLLMALHAKHTGPHEDDAVDEYGRRATEDPCKSKMSAKDRAWMQRGVEFLVKHQVDGHWRYPAGGADLSNTQYALLGLWAAARCGFEIEADVWLKALGWVRSMQQSSGRPVKLLVNEVRGDYRVAWTEDAQARGFTYLPKVPPVTGSMTTAGLASLAICQDELWDSRKFTPELRKGTRRALRDAMAWMQDNFETKQNPGHPTGGWHYYYLYGIERAGVLSRSRFMGTVDWYLDGARHLLDAQRGDGSWLSEHQDLDTAFAILFLKRSTARTRNPVITPSHR